MRVSGIIRKIKMRGYVLDEEMEMLNSEDNLYKGLSSDYINTVVKVPYSKLRNKFITYNRECFDIDRFYRYAEFVKETPRGGVYIPEYWELLLGVSPETAKAKVESYKKDKTTSKEGFIKRHGEEEGLVKFARFQESSARSLQTKIDSDYNFRESTPFCKEYWIKRGETEERAVESVKDFQKHNAGVNSHIWVSKGLSEVEIGALLKDINSKKGSSYSVEKLAKKDNISVEDAEEVIAQRKIAMVDTFISKQERIPRHLVVKYKKYCQTVRYLTDKRDLSSIPNIEKRGKEFNYQIDHKYSILKGFLDNVPEEIVSCVGNLQCIPSEVNLAKGVDCDISLEDLYKIYEKDKL